MKAWQKAAVATKKNAKAIAEQDAVKLSALGGDQEMEDRMQAIKEKKETGRVQKYDK